MKGSCNCGAVSFEMTNNITGLYQCHCTLCQKQSGSTSNTSTIVRASDFKWISGEGAITEWEKETGFSSHFCKKCGSPVPNKLRRTDFYWVPMGLVEHTNLNLNIVKHLCCQSKASWDNLPKGKHISQYDDMPEDLNAFVASFQSK